MADFLIRVVVDPRAAVDGSRRVRRELENTETSAGRLQRSLRNAFTVAAITLAAREVTRLADTYTNLQNRLRTVTDTQEELQVATSRLFEIADRTRTSFEGTAEVYARVGLAAQELGRDQEELLNFTESLNQAVVLSGASATEAQAGLLQLSQGLASGSLRGDELRSVLEQLPVVADVIAKSLGVTRGELRKLGSEGKISAEIVLDAFKEAREELAERFGETVPTVSQSFTVLRNNVIEYVGSADQATGATATLASSVILISENVDVAAGGVVVLAVALLTSYVPATLTASAATSGLLVRVRALSAAAIANPFVLATAAITAAGVATTILIDDFIELQEQIARFEAAGADLGLTEFGRIGDDILRLQRQVEQVRGNVARGNEGQIPLLQQLEERLASLREQQELVASGTARTRAEAEEYQDAVEDLATSIQSTVDAIEDENRLLGLNSREREVQIDLLEQVKKLQEEGGPELTAAQREELEAAIRRNQVLREQADVLERIQGPQQQFQTDLQALQALLDTDRISQEQFNVELQRMIGLLDQAELESLNLQSLFDGIEGIDPASVDKILADIRAAVEAGLGTIPVTLKPEFDPLETFTQGAPEPDSTSQFRLDVFDQINAPAQQFAQTQAALGELLDANAISAEQYAVALNNVTIATNTISTDASQGFAAGLAQVENQLLDVSGTAADVVVQSFGAAQDALSNFFRTGELDGQAFFSTLLDGFADLLAQQALLALLGGGGESGVFGFNLFGGGKAGGGDVNPHQAFLVGEDGPELFSPPGAGTITPAGETAAMFQQQRMPAPVVNVSPPAVNIVNVSDPKEIPSGIESAEGETAVLNVMRRNRRVVRGL